ncbi:ABC transporter ATP-binding protein [Lewinella cohaerens]|uniref:ABC transporter ATP-binding protein n=1 Tax=Lewinella cohaerens TaxID=70995 RepID=UPI0003668C84|nr:ABC transporter ATP-binding protein [Lewinella cohaerens]
MIEVQALSKVFGETIVVDDLSFQVKEGETLALLGTSGSGKTTTLKMLNRLIEPSEGKILLKGEDVRELPLEAMRRRMGYVIQDVGLFPHYTIAENIAVVPRLLKWPEARIAARCQLLLERLGLAPEVFLTRFPHELSGGQQQRVGIARALAAEPPVLLMDEPFSALDPITRQELRRDFRELEAFQQQTVILVTHDVMEAFELADQICLLDKGQLQQIGSPRELLFSPANDFVRNFFAAQRLGLAYQVLTVDDLQGLNNTAPSASFQEVPFPSTASLQEVLEQLLVPGPKVKIGVNEVGQWFSPAQITETAAAFLQEGF